MKIIHQTKGRIRFHHPLIDSKLDKSLFLTKLRLIEGACEVGVNTVTHSFWLRFDPPYEDRILEEVHALDMQRYRCESTACVHDENISQTGMIRAGLALLLARKTAPLLGKTATALAIAPLMGRAFTSLFKEGLNATFLEGLAVGISAYRGDLLAANSTNFLLEAGEYIEESTIQKSNALLQELIRPPVEEVWCLKNGEEQQVPFASVRVGDIVIVHAGDCVPVDGHVVSGMAVLNQASMTGESVGIEKKRGDQVLSGTVVEEGRLAVWAENVGAETATARIGEYIQSSLDAQSETQVQANRLADKLVPMTLGLAAASYAWSKDLNRAASVLQADYSCALKLATPVAFRASISRLGKKGVMVKGADVLERLSMVDTFVFDKTGTLTKGHLEVVNVYSFKPDWSEQKVLNLAASAEEHYFHPVAQAVVEAAKQLDFVHVHHEAVEFIVAHGVATEVDGKRVVIGSRHFLQDDEGIDTSAHQELIEKKEEEGKMLLYVGFDSELIGVITLSDSLRDETCDTLRLLKEYGIQKIVMLTGDSETKARQIGDLVGIDDVYAELKPTDKAEIVKQLIAQGRKVAFVGDGINDAPALVLADVGISMAKGADIAKASSDISLLADNISALAWSYRTAAETMERIRNNFAIAVGANSSILLAAASGLLSPISSSLLHNGTTVGLLGNALRGISAIPEDKERVTSP